MICKDIKNKNIREYQIFFSPILFRIFLYILITIFYYYFMQTYSPLGIKWRPYHFERIVNAIENISENSLINYIGYTSWNSVQEVTNYLENNIGEIYLVPLIGYLPQAFLNKLIPNYQLLNLGSFFDYILISIVGFLVSEIGLYVMEIRNKFQSLFYGTILFSLFLTSPWAYRMMIAPWFEVSFLTFYLLSIYFFILNKKYLGLLFVFLAGLMHWIWIFFLFIFVIFNKIISFFLGNLLEKDYSYRYLQNTLQNKKGFYLYSLACGMPIVIHGIQLLFLRIMNINHSGSKALYRIGIDSFNNIHHGGIIAALQFLGGSRFSVCFTNSQLDNLSTLEKYISYFNCSSAIASLFSLSLLSIFGLIVFIKNSKKAKWIFMPLSWSILFYGLLFQQSFAVHLQGYSFIFAFIFTINILYLIIYIEKKIKLPKPIEILINIPLIIGILINSIRVSYLINTI